MIPWPLQTPFFTTHSARHGVHGEIILPHDFTWSGEDPMTDLSTKIRSEWKLSAWRVKRSNFHFGSPLSEPNASKIWEFRRATRFSHRVDAVMIHISRQKKKNVLSTQTSQWPLRKASDKLPPQCFSDKRCSHQPRPTRLNIYLGLSTGKLRTWHFLITLYWLFSLSLGSWRPL